LRDQEPLVKVAVAENPLTAQLIQDSLAEAGIRSLLRNRDGAAVVLGTLGAGSWSIDVYVLAGDADAASVILGGEPVPEPLPPPSLASSPAKRRRRWRFFG
jgi:hypothetical protein